VCGIVGILDPQQKGIDPSLLEQMNQSQFHRGPDEGGIHIEPGIGLGHRRLSIIDLSSGRQPLFNEDGSVVVTYNGEIYNYQELARKLKQAGHVFRTHCDTEVIVHAWEQWGEDCVQRFRGMFAFAVWDRNQQTLFMARDRMGIKPLYYAILPRGQFIFASELKALLLHPELPRKIDTNAVEDYFTFGYVPEPKSILSNAFKLAPAHTLTIKSGNSKPVVRQYWEVPFSAVEVNDEEGVAEELVNRLREAVKIRMVADVPIGAFLSGGVDSSSVVAMMAGLSNAPIKTCSISFGDPQFNEARFAKQVADQYKTNHLVKQVDTDDFQLVDKLASLYDEPYADSSAIPTYRVCELARTKVTVALSGDGGDENLAGYRRHRWHMYEERVRSRIPQWFRGPIFGLLGYVYPKADWAPKVLRAKTTLQALARDTLDAYLHSVSIIPETQRARIFNNAFVRELNGYRAREVFHKYALNAPTDHPLSLIQYLDMKTYLPGDILTKVDRASMAHALEVRVPILDHEFVEWISGLPPQLKLDGRSGKHILKKAMELHLPKEILYRPKMGFAVPLANWFRGPLRDHVRNAVLGSVLADTEIFDMRYVARVVDDHQRGLYDHSAVLWSLLMFESFCRKVLDNNSN